MQILIKTEQCYILFHIFITQKDAPRQNNNKDKHLQLNILLSGIKTRIQNYTIYLIIIV